MHKGDVVEDAEGDNNYAEDHGEANESDKIECSFP